ERLERGRMENWCHVGDGQESCSVKLTKCSPEAKSCNDSFRWPGKTRRRVVPFCPYALTQSLETNVEHRDQEDSDGTGCKHAGESRCADAAAGNLRRSRRPNERYQPRNECDGSHHHRPKAQFRSAGRRLMDAQAPLALGLCEFDNKDAVLGRPRDEHD